MAIALPSVHAAWLSQVPLEAVLEALDYVTHNPEIVEQDREREAARLRARGLLDGPDQA
jgi:hypothetical protein